MDKLLTFLPYNTAGEQVVVPIIDRETSSFEKTASSLLPEVQQFITKLAADPNRTYLLVNALGAGEYWSSNVNGDFFEEHHLKTAYPTFMSAHPFEHHVNKDPKKALGKVELAAWNPAMHRVELIISIDNTKAPHIIKKINNGEYPAVSMGAKVPYDICSICGNKAKSVRNYCVHLKRQMNQIYPDGRKVYAKNPNPRFFDISFVLIGADKTARVLKKVASEGANVCADLPEVLASALEADLTEEMYREKMALSKKLAKIYKDVPADDVRVIRQAGTLIDEQILPVVEANEARLSKTALDKLAQHDLDEVFSTLTFSGIVLHPEEFQRIALVKTGKAKLADELDSKGIVFEIPEDEDEHAVDMFKTANFSDSVFQTVSPYVKHRSVFTPFFEERLEKLATRAKVGYPMPSITPVMGGGVRVETKKTEVGKEFAKILATLGLGYLLYRKAIPKSEWGNLDRMLSDHPMAAASLLAGVAGGLAVAKKSMDPTPTEQALMTRSMFKGASAVSTVAVPIAASYLGGAYAHRKRMKGQRLSRFENFLADYPMIAGLGGALLLGKAKGATKHLAKVGSQHSSESDSVEKVASLAGDVAATIGTGWVKPSLPAVAGLAVDFAALGALSKAISGLSKGSTERGAQSLLEATKARVPKA